MHTLRLSEDLRYATVKKDVLEETVVPDLSSPALLLCPGDYHLLPGYLLCNNIVQSFNHVLTLCNSMDCNIPGFPVLH